MAKRKSFSIGTSLTHALEDTVNVARSYSGDLNIEVVPLRKIETDPDNPRELSLTFNDVFNGISKNDLHYVKKNKEKESLQTIANSIKEQGVLNPIIVYKHGEKYRLITGERRSLASIICGKDYIQARVLHKKPDPITLSVLQWIENIEREDLTLWERLRNLEKITLAFAESKGKTIKEVSASDLSSVINCSLQQAVNYKNFLNSSKRLKSLIQTNHIKNIEKASLISKSPAEIQDMLIEACLNGASLKKLKDLAENSEKQEFHNKKEKRGRQLTRINFGNTKNISVAKIIITAIVKQEQFRNLEKELRNIDWNDYSSVSNTFKLFINTIENSVKK